MNFIPEHLGLAARDPEALKNWYLRTLGAKLVFDNGQTPPAYLLALGQTFLIEIYPAASSCAETENNSVAGWRHLALRVNSIARAKTALEKKGVIFTDPVKPAGGGGLVLFFRDLEGNLLHLVERPKTGAPWHRAL